MGRTCREWNDLPRSGRVDSLISERPCGVVGVAASEWLVGYLDAVRQRRPSVEQCLKSVDDEEGSYPPG